MREVSSAPTVASALMVTVHAAEPVQAPLHAPRIDPESGVAESATCAPAGKVPVHVVRVHARPVGVDAIAPLPVPLSETFNVNELGAGGAGGGMSAPCTCEPASC